MILPIRRFTPPHRVAVIVATVLAAVACSSEPSSDAPAGAAQPIGSELMAQQAPPGRAPPQQAPILDLSTAGYVCPRYNWLSEYQDNVSGPAGRLPFYWTRAVYTGNGFRGNSWAIDFPKSDEQFLIVIKRLVRLNAYDCENPVRLDDPDLRKFPLIYMLEVGGMDMTEAEVAGLRGYMEAGGFVIVDDFWGQRQWDRFAWNMRRVFPAKTFVDIGLDHPVYSAYYDIDHVEQVAAIGNTIRRTECAGCYPEVKGMYDDDGRLMMMVNFNTDLGDAWEWAENPSYPLEMSTYAYQMGANMIVYAMSH